MHECSHHLQSLVASLRVWKRPRDVVESPLQDAIDGGLLKNKEQKKKITHVRTLSTQKAKPLVTSSGKHAYDVMYDNDIT